MSEPSAMQPSKPNSEPPAAPSQTPLYQLLDARLHAITGRRLYDAVALRRPAAAWRTIAAEIYDVTGIRITGETLRTWFAASDPPPPAMS